MARYPKKMTAKAYINIDGKNVLWYEIDEDGNTTWYLPEEKTEKFKQKMLDNIGRSMSNYIMNHPESAMWESS